MMDISKTLTDIAAKLLDLGEAHASEDLEFCRDQIEAEKAHLRAESAALKSSLERAMSTAIATGLAVAR